MGRPRRTTATCTGLQPQVFVRGAYRLSATRSPLLQRIHSSGPRRVRSCFQISPVVRRKEKTTEEKRWHGRHRATRHRYVPLADQSPSLTIVSSRNSQFRKVLFLILSPVPPLKHEEECRFSSRRQVPSLSRYWCSTLRHYLFQWTDYTRWNMGPSRFPHWFRKTVCRLFECMQVGSCLGGPNYLSLRG